MNRSVCTGPAGTQILTVAQAEALGNEDYYRRSTADHKLYADGLNIVEAIHSYRERSDKLYPGRVVVKEENTY